MIARSDVVGSLLRPPELLAARTDYEAGRLGAAAFKAAEDRAVDAAVAQQEAAGLDVVTDGEMRRLSFQSQLAEAVSGFGDWDVDAFLWGDWQSDAVGDHSLERPRNLGVVDKLERKRHLSVEELVYLRSRTDRVAKVTLPSPSLYANFWSPEISTGAYPTFDGFLADVADILRDEVAELARLGATYVQLDAPHYPLLLDRRTAAYYEARGWTVESWLARGIELDNAVMAGAPGVTFGFHLCRGNQGSRWLVEGSYEAIARPIFQGIAAHRLLLEYDDERSGDFEPLRHIPEDKTVVLGLVTTKTPELEDPDALVARIETASAYVPKNRLAVSPQCGFGTSVLGNALSIEQQAAKLKLVGDVARRVWD
ncbi:MAG: cobalamin-independent methionine synthase II family protein [Rhodospirillales bacterium]|jgi:5-methyltetrahydropteroyltriglutamate--homocysteine methyltransferase|nr:cobalamin-independent methionine synthase II family protein [Rhodospirillales bacterium]